MRFVIYRYVVMATYELCYPSTCNCVGSDILYDENCYYTKKKKRIF